MEKKIARVIRWLERCSKGCGAQSWQNALLDMECAKAEMEEARQDLWALAEGAGRKSNPARGAVRTLGVTCTACLLLLLAAVPLATPPAQNALVVVESEPSLEWVSADEKNLLASLRKGLSEANFASLSEEQSAPLQGSILPRAETKRTSERPPIVPSGRNTRTAPRETHDMDAVYSLVQIGKEALNTAESPIRYVRETPEEVGRRGQ